MPIVTDKFTFYHCPRTGGTWVRTVLERLGVPYRTVGYHHSTPAECPPEDNSFSFTIVRNPDEWLFSWRRLVDSNPQWAWPVGDQLLNAKTRDDAVRVFAAYSHGVDFVIANATLRADLQSVFDHVGYDLTVPDLPPVNVSML